MPEFDIFYGDMYAKELAVPARITAEDEGTAARIFYGLYPFDQAITRIVPVVEPAEPLANEAQITRAKRLLGWCRMWPSKNELTRSVSKGRTVHMHELYCSEIAQLITSLDAINDSMGRQRRKIFAMCHEMGWEKGDGKVDTVALDKWCTSHGAFSKKLSDHTQAELTLLISQFENVHLSIIKRKKTHA